MTPARMAVRRVQDLRIYGIAFEVAMRIFEASKSWPKAETFALTDQARRSSRAVCANLAEAWAKRRYPRHFIAKLSDAHAEAAETEVWVSFAERCGYLLPDDATSLQSECRHVAGALVTMMNQPDQWCGPATLLREPEPIYATPP